jgi:cell division inhibitor SepF
MANSTFSGLSDRASGALSGLRNRFGGGSKNQDRYDDDYSYNDYGYDDYADYNDYGEYGYDPDEPYDDYTDSQDIGEIRTRSVSSSARNHPPLLSFDEARVNTYVPDRLLRDPLDRTASRSRYTENGYRPRVRDSVNVGHAAEYDFASVGGAQLDETGAEIPQVEVAKPAPKQTGYDPYASYQGSGAATHSPTRKLKVILPASYGDVESVAHALKAGDVVVLGLKQTPGDLAKRVLDFSFGVASALDASVDCVADKVFVVCRGNGLSDGERLSLKSQGIL